MYSFPMNSGSHPYIQMVMHEIITHDAKALLTVEFNSMNDFVRKFVIGLD